MSKRIPVELLRLLCDRQIHSGEEIGRLLGISRAAIWKQVQKIEELGFGVVSLKGQGYQLVDTVDLFDKEELSHRIHECHGLFCEVFDEIDSTNSELMRRIQSGSGSLDCCVISEMQTAGRGRRGREWVSPFAQNLYFSIPWVFEDGLVALEGLSLAIGVAVVESLHEIGCHEISVKWPNDILYKNRKLAGILVEVVGEPAGRCNVVMGVGLNVHKYMNASGVIDQPWVALDEILGGICSRTDILLQILRHLVPSIRMFETEGFEPFLHRWNQFDSYQGKEVMVQVGNEVVFGCVAGVDHSGELLLETPNGVKRFTSGEVSLRLDL